MKIDEHASYPAVIFLFLLGAAFLVLGFLSKWDRDTLAAQGVEAEATVTGSRVLSEDGKLSYEVQYAFKPDPQSPEIHRSDFLKRKNLWSVLPKPEYDEAVASGKLRIRYVPSNPGNNAPALFAPKYGDIWALIGLGGVLTLLGIGGLAGKIGKKGGASTAPRRFSQETIAPLRYKVPAKTYGMASIFAVPILVVAGVLYRQPGDEKYALIFAGGALLIFLNVAAIRLFFDGKQIRYTSLMKRTKISMDEVTGVKIGYGDNGQMAGAFFYVSTRERGDIMLNLRLFAKADAQEFCQALTRMGIEPQVADGVRARDLANFLYTEAPAAGV